MCVEREAYSAHGRHVSHKCQNGMEQAVAGAKGDGVPSSQASVQMLNLIEMFDQLYIKGGLPRTSMNHDIAPGGCSML